MRVGEGVRVGGEAAVLSEVWCVVQELQPGVATPGRVRAMKELNEIVATKRLEEVSVEGEQRWERVLCSAGPTACSAGHLEGRPRPAAAKPASGGEAHHPGLHPGPGERAVPGAGHAEGTLLQSHTAAQCEGGCAAEVSTHSHRHTH